MVNAYGPFGFTEHTEEQVVLVDAHDRVCGQANKEEAHRKAWLHRAFSVFLWRKEDGAVFLQQRQAAKYHSALKWSNACCGHPRPGEETKLAAERRLREELGFSLALQPAGTFYYRAACGESMWEHEWDHVFFAEVTDGWLQANCRPNPQEVASWSWMQLGQLQQDLQENPERYTPWLAAALACCLSDGMQAC